MRLELMTSPEVEKYLRGCRGIVLPVGSTEQHGPMGLIGTDHLCPQVIARGFGEKHGVIVAPTLALGMSQFHLGFPGSLTLRPSTLSAVIGDIIASLDITGFTRLYILNGHGGNLAPIRSAVQEFYAARSLSGTGPSRMMVRVRSWWELPTVNALRKSLYGDAEGFHATPSELAVTMASEPENIGEFDLPPPAVETHGLLDHAGDNYLDATDYRNRFPDGRVVSHSALARRADGERLIAAGVADLAEDFAAFIAAA
jgi:creatinine amidohydrolase